MCIGTSAGAFERGLKEGKPGSDQTEEATNNDDDDTKSDADETVCVLLSI